MGGMGKIVSLYKIKIKIQIWEMWLRTFFKENLHSYQKEVE